MANDSHKLQGKLIELSSPQMYDSQHPTAQAEVLFML